jgi:hypothetical protein
MIGALRIASDAQTLGNGRAMYSRLSDLLMIPEKAVCEELSSSDNLLYILQRSNDEKPETE